MKTQIHATFDDTRHARAAIHQLVERHFSPRSIEVRLHRDGTSTEIPVGVVLHVPQGIVLMSALGGLAGMLSTAALWGWTPAMVGMGGLFGLMFGFVGGALFGLAWWDVQADLPDYVAPDDAVEVRVTAGNRNAPRARAVFEETGAVSVAG